MYELLEDSYGDVRTNLGAESTPCAKLLIGSLGR